MVRALLQSTKTQTRRVVKPQPVARQGMVNARYCGHPNLWLRDGKCDITDPAKEWRCPYGQPGDRLWVRETFSHFERNDQLKPGAEIFYRAEDECLELRPWRPSIHMPRWASRITLEITGVRVERLQDISEADAMAEGAPPSHPSIDRISREFGYADFPRSWYAQLWEQINGPGSWDANPWVWAVEFRRLEGAA